MLDLTPLPVHTRISEGAEDFSQHIQIIHAEVRRRLVVSDDKYKQHADLHLCHVAFDVGDLVLIRLLPERFPKGTFHKLHHRRAVPFKVFKQLGSNAHHLELSPTLSISPIFNVEDLTAYLGPEDGAAPTEPGLAPNVIFPAPLPSRNHIEEILDDQIVSTRWGGYQKFLIKWKNRSFSDCSWLQTEEVQCLNPDLYDAYLAKHSTESSSFPEGGN